MDIDSQDCIHKWLFSKLSNHEGALTGPVEPVNGIDNDVCGAKLQPTADSAYPVDWDCLCHLLNTLYCWPAQQNHSSFNA